MCCRCINNVTSTAKTTDRMDMIETSIAEKNWSDKKQSAHAREGMRGRGEGHETSKGMPLIN